MKVMKTFKDLVFQVRRSGGIQARMPLGNGFNISVVGGKYAYSTPKEDKDSPDDFDSFEVAIFDSNDDFATDQFVSNHDDDVLGWQDRGQINAILLLIQNQK